jgi:hypothetical protein
MSVQNALADVTAESDPTLKRGVCKILCPIWTNKSYGRYFLPCAFFVQPELRITRFSVSCGTENLLLLLRKLRGLLVCLRHAQLHFQRNVPTSARKRASSL